MGKVESFPEPDKLDHTQTAARAVLDIAAAWFPPVSVVSVFFKEVIPNRLDRKREEWFRALGNLVEELAQESVDVKSDEFIDAVLRATTIGMSKGTEGKIEMLVAALKGFAGDQQKNDVLTERMFALIEELSPKHMLALRQLLETERTSVFKTPAQPIITHLKSNGWKHRTNCRRSDQPTHRKKPCRN